MGDPPPDNFDWITNVTFTKARSKISKKVYAHDPQKTNTLKKYTLSNMEITKKYKCVVKECPAYKFLVAGREITKSERLTFVQYQNKHIHHSVRSVPLKSQNPNHDDHDLSGTKEQDMTSQDEYNLANATLANDDQDVHIQSNELVFQIGDTNNNPLNIETQSCNGNFVTAKNSNVFTKVAQRKKIKIKTFKFCIKESLIENAGQGLFNCGDTIKKGIYFGPYPGEQIPIDRYLMELEGGLREDSGYGFEIMDQLNQVKFLVDPGKDFNAKEGTNWMAKINHSADPKKINIKGKPNYVRDEMYFETTRCIENGEELYLYYGISFEILLNENSDLKSTEKL